MALAFVLWPAVFAQAWGERGHVLITEAALVLLAEDAPAFLKTDAARQRMVYLSGEPDRWRNLDLPPMGHINKPEHYFDLDLLPLYELTPQTLPPYRHDYIAALAVYKATHPERNYGDNPAKDQDHSQEWPGLAPYRICELYVQLKSSWQTLHACEASPKTADEAGRENARQNIIYLMGLMSHYVADLAQPLHTTRHHHGWVGENPCGYTRSRSIHGLIDGEVIQVVRFDVPALLKLKPPKRILAERRLFAEVLKYVSASHREVRPLYELERRGSFRPQSPDFPTGAEFVRRRMVAGAVMLTALWESAYRDAGRPRLHARVSGVQIRGREDPRGVENE